MELASLPISILSGMASAVVYSIIFYAKKKQAGQEFDMDKFIATVIVGAAIGLGLGISGTEITQENVVQILVANVGVIALIESMIKWTQRKLTAGNDGPH
jgi:uncharacterized membrane protein AbrB (regulator of aidB expression)